MTGRGRTDPSYSTDAISLLFWLTAQVILPKNRLSFVSFGATGGVPGSEYQSRRIWMPPKNHSLSFLIGPPPLTEKSRYRARL